MGSTGPKLLEALATIQSEIYRYEVEKEQWEQEKISFQLQINVLKAENQKLNSIQSHLQRRIEMLEKTIVEERNNVKSNQNQEIEIKDIEIQKEEAKIDDNQAKENPPNFSKLLKYNEKLKEISTKLTKLITHNVELPLHSFPSLNLPFEIQNNGNNQNNKDNTENQVEEIAKENNDKKERKEIQIEENDKKIEIQPLDNSTEHKNNINNNNNDIANGELKKSEDRKENNNNNNERWEDEEEPVSYPTIVIHPQQLKNIIQQSKIESNDNNNNDDKNKKLDENKEEQYKEVDTSKFEPIVGENGNPLENMDKKFLSLLGNSSSSHDDSSFKKSNFVNWKPLSTIRAHFDAIRTVQFHPELPLLLTGSDDCTLKLFNISLSSSPKIEDIHTYYGHKTAILSCAITNDQSFCFSASVDGVINQWELPSDLQAVIDDPFPQLGKASSYFVKEYKHKDAVWDLALNSLRSLLFSASSDGSVKIFDYSNQSQLCEIYHPSNDKSIIPTSISVNQSNDNQLLIGYNNCNLNIYDIEKETTIKQLHHSNAQNNQYPVDFNKQLNKVVSHTLLPLAFAGYEDKFIRYFDLRSGECIYSMVAHQDSISTLAVDPSGSYLLSGGHDSSLRVWDIAQKSCVQEIQANRKKFDESILCAAFHPKLNLVVSSGADATLKFIRRSE